LIRVPGLLVALVLAGCTNGPAPGEPATDFVGQDWSLLTIGGVAVVPGPTLRIEADGHAGGNATCNRFFTRAVIAGNGVTFSPAGTTRMACQPADRADQESRYTLTLSRVAHWRVDGGKLILTDGDGNDVLTYARTP
jgi:putative lipoprotein